MKSVFLTAEWRKLIMFNYSVDPLLLQPYLPPGTQLDIWEGKCYVSLVGFMFQETRVKGFKIPFNVNFEEVNLRFYVTFQENGVTKRGTVFISEIVPKIGVMLVANTLYGENYATRRMDHHWSITSDTLDITYRWKEKGEWQEIGVRAHNTPALIDVKSHEGFITEHYWGYSKKSTNTTMEYGVEHPVWKNYPLIDYKLSVDFGRVYGEKFAGLNQLAPSSVLLVEGSEIIIRSGQKWVISPNT